MRAAEATDDDKTKNPSSTTDSNEPVRVSLNLPADVVRVLKELAQKEGRTMTEIIRRGIETEDFLYGLRAKNAKIIVRQDGEDSVLVFK